MIVLVWEGFSSFTVSCPSPPKWWDAHRLQGRSPWKHAGWNHSGLVDREKSGSTASPSDLHHEYGNTLKVCKNYRENAIKHGGWARDSALASGSSTHASLCRREGRPRAVVGQEQSPPGRLVGGRGGAGGLTVAGEERRQRELVGMASLEDVGGGGRCRPTGEGRRSSRFFPEKLRWSSLFFKER
jgi:hypothetical protein